MCDEILATYRIRCAAAELEALAVDIAWEQSLEVPQDLPMPTRIRTELLGRVTALRPDAGGADVHEADIAFNADLASAQMPQLLNLLYGNISIKGNITLTDLNLPASFLAHFSGPKYGTAGIREILGVAGRPLLATAIKPRGLEVAGFADIVRRFAMGGGDLIKDDHNLSDSCFETFQARIKACGRAVDEAASATGRQCLYFPNILVPLELLDQCFAAVVKQGIRGVLVCPQILGFDVIRAYSQKYPLVFMTHPAFAGSFYADRLQGIAPDLHAGTLMRMIGCDISVFPNFGGRFGLHEQECIDINTRLSESLGALKSAMPAPAGGMSFERLPSLGKTYGEDAVFLIGGGLLKHGEALSEATANFLEVIRAAFPERSVTADTEFLSACELPAAQEISPQTHLPFTDKFSWEHRPEVAYKGDDALPFQGVKRVELLGNAGEKMDFDLRYFELEPGGFTSHEKHVHTHAIIAVRGEGLLQIEEEEMALKPMDIAYVDALKSHQLRNPSEEAFGFFCIVDRDRDKPMPA